MGGSKGKGKSRHSSGKAHSAHKSAKPRHAVKKAKPARAAHAKKHMAKPKPRLKPKKALKPVRAKQKKAAAKRAAIPKKAGIKQAAKHAKVPKLPKHAAKKHKRHEEEIIEESFAPIEKKITGLEVQIVPAILAKARHEFEYKMYTVLPHANRIQIDIMDGKFVPNITVGENEKVPLKDKLVVEYHLMVENPTEYIKLIDNPDALYIAHVEAQESPEEVVRFCKAEGYRLALAINPATQIGVLDKFIEDVEMVLFMTVVPGFSGQKYMKQVEQKIAQFKQKYPKMPVEVDGGIGEENIAGARAAGANLFAAASSIFSKPDVKAAMDALYAKAAKKE